MRNKLYKKFYDADIRGRYFVDSVNNIGICFTDTSIEIVDPETNKVIHYFEFTNAEEVD